MIVIAIIFHKLGHYIPLWILKDNFENLREQFSLKRLLVELSGLLFNFLVAFLIIYFINILTPEKYLLNKDAIYGIEFSHVAKEIGFKDGDKIISIDNKDVEKFSDILKSILLSSGQIKVKIQRDSFISNILISDNERRKLIDRKERHFSPIGINYTSDKNEIGLKLHERRRGIKETLQSFNEFLKYYKLLLFPEQTRYNSTGFMVLKVADLKSFFYMFAMTSFIVGLINLLPLPGFDVGNIIIGYAEKTRNKKFNRKKLKYARIISVSLVVVVILLKIFIN